MDKIEYVDISSTGQGKIESTKTYKASEAPSRAKRVVKDGDVIISRVRPGRKQYAFVRNSPDNLVVSTGFIVLRPKEDEEIHPEYLYYATTSDKFMNEMERRKTGSTYPSTNISEVKSMRISVPEYQQQLNIVNTLSPIDRKIELNRELAGLLEETAHAIYESWFEAYEPYDIPDEQDQPDGFENLYIPELLDVKYGYGFDSDKFNNNGEGVPLVRIRNISDGHTDTYTTEDFGDEYELEAGDALVGLDGTFEPDIWRGRKAALNQRVARFRPTERVSDSKMYTHLAIKKPFKKMSKQATGTTVEHIHKKDIDNSDIVVPDKQSIEKFKESTEAMFEDIVRMERENEYLETLRDYLLPQLLSGEIVIQDEEDEQEDTTQGDTK